MSSARRRLVLVVPDLFDRGGGIARISRATTLACDRLCQRNGWEFAALALHDSGRARDERYISTRSEYHGYRSDRLALARAVLIGAYRRDHLGTVFAHVNMGALGLLFPPNIGNGPRRFAVVAHGVDVWGKLPVHRRLALAHAAEVWPVSCFTGVAVAQRHRVPEERVRVIYNCLDPHWEARLGALGPNSRPEDPFILTVSRLGRGDRYKGVDVLISAFSRVADQLPGFTLRIVGDGEDLPRLQDVARKAGRAERIRFLGALADADVQRLYRDCAFFSLPSAKEGFGLVFLEAMAARKGVVAASAGAVPEVVADGDTGLLVPYADVEGLAAALLELGNAPSRAAALGAAGFERLRSKFMFAHYEALIAERIEAIWRC